MAKRVRAETRFLTPGPQPNGLQAVADGLWVMDQRDQHIYKLAWSDGALLHKAPTAAAHASGITWDGYHLWLASTFTPQVLLQVDPATGNEIRRLPSPGVETGQGPHGLEWIAGLLWVTVPDPVNTTFQLEPASGRVWRQFPAPGTVTPRPRLGRHRPLVRRAPHSHARPLQPHRRGPRRIGDQRRPRPARPDLARRPTVVLRCRQPGRLHDHSVARWQGTGPHPFPQPFRRARERAIHPRRLLTGVGARHAVPLRRRPRIRAVGAQHVAPRPSSFRRKPESIPLILPS